MRVMTGKGDRHGGAGRVSRTVTAGALAFVVSIAPFAAYAQDAAAPAQPQAASPESPAAAPVDAVQPPAPAAQAPAGGEPAPAQAAPGLPADPVPFEQPQPPAVDSATLPHNLSPWGMFMAADWVVKSVMIGLAFASLVTWTVWLAKSLELMAARRRMSRALGRIVESRNLDEAEQALSKGNGPAALLVRAAARETAASLPALDHAGGDGLKERVTSHLSRIEAQATRRMTRGTGVLATIGSTAPFVGLFGTVWGIMNSFIGISEAQTTNLAVVAPGIAEALLATALGLVAAIPAVVIYNVFARSIAGYKLLLADTSAAVERLVSRDLDYRAVPEARRTSVLSAAAE